MEKDMSALTVYMVVNLKINDADEYRRINIKY